MIVTTIFRALTVASTIAVCATPAVAQPPAAPADLIVRSGDTITWTPVGVHRVRFGGTLASSTLTPGTDIEKVLTKFTPPLPAKPASGEDVRIYPAATKVTAVVKAGADTQGVPSFFFTCGFQPHSPIMITVPFVIQPAVAGQAPRTIEIISDPTGALQWLVKTASGNKTLKRNP